MQYAFIIANQDLLNTTSINIMIICFSLFRPPSSTAERNHRESNEQQYHPFTSKHPYRHHGVRHSIPTILLINAPTSIIGKFNVEQSECSLDRRSIPSDVEHREL